MKVERSDFLNNHLKLYKTGKKCTYISRLAPESPADDLRKLLAPEIP